MIEEGQQAPDFELVANDGTPVRLSTLHGMKVVLYFYPRDDTPGCTKQACGLRDVYAEIERAGAVVLGVSPDDGASHTRFKDKHALPFTLLADSDHAVAETYGVWREKTLYGRTYMGVYRSTFVIDVDGTVEQALYGVKPAAHAQTVLDAI